MTTNFRELRAATAYARTLVGVPSTFTVAATDAVGNASSQSVTYTVAYAICLLYDPTKASPAGRLEPIRLKLCDVNGTNVGSASITVTAISVSPSGVLQSPDSRNPGGVFMFLNTGGYQFDLITKGYAPASTGSPRPRRHPLFVPSFHLEESLCRGAGFVPASAHGGVRSLPCC